MWVSEQACFPGGRVANSWTSLILEDLNVKSQQEVCCGADVFHSHGGHGAYCVQVTATMLARSVRSKKEYVRVPGRMVAPRSWQCFYLGGT